MREFRRQEGGPKELAEAQADRLGGRGLKAAEHYKLIEDLGNAMGAALGASRAIVDDGWVSHSFQVGQTGQDGFADALHRLRDLRRDPAPGRHVVLQGDRGHQQGPRGADLQDRRTTGSWAILFEVLPALTAEARSHFASRA